jgi:hypothetical protein
MTVVMPRIEVRQRCEQDVQFALVNAQTCSIIVAPGA